MNKESANFKDGLITKTEVASTYITLSVQTIVTESGEMTVFLDVHPNGCITMRFVGIGDSKVEAINISSNGLDLYVRKNETLH